MSNQPQASLTNRAVWDLFFPGESFPGGDAIPEGAHGQRQFTVFNEQKCPKCHHGTINSVGDCYQCDFSHQDYHGPY